MFGNSDPTPGRHDTAAAGAGHSSGYSLSVTKLIIFDTSYLLTQFCVQQTVQIREQLHGKGITVIPR